MFLKQHDHHAVENFHTVDYEAISMLNVSATQELYKQLLNLISENNELKMVNTRQQNKIAGLNNRVEQINQLLGQTVNK